MSAAESLNAVGKTLDELDRLTGAVHAQLVTLSMQANAYANAVHALRLQGIEPPIYSGSETHARANMLVRMLDNASKMIGFTSLELTRFGGY